MLSWLIQISVIAVTHVYLSLAVQLKLPQVLEQEYGEGVSYLAFLMCGMAFNVIVQTSLSAPRNSINPWNIEWLLLSPVTLLDVILGTGWFWYMIGLFEVSVFLLFGIVNGAVFHFDILSSLAILVMGAASIWGLGMVSAGVQVVTKRWDPISYILYRIGWLISGLFFPMSLLPTWLQPVSWIIPQSYILEMARQTMLAGKSIFQMGYLPLYLLLYCIISLALGSSVFLRCVKVAKKQGTIGFF